MHEEKMRGKEKKRKLISLTKFKFAQSRRVNITSQYNLKRIFYSCAQIIFFSPLSPPHNHSHVIAIIHYQNISGAHAKMRGKSQ